MKACLDSAKWPAHLVQRARQPPPEGCAVIPKSTPVVAFGDPRRVRVATLGINPSSAEFNDRSGELLTGPRRRLATLDSIGAGSYTGIDDEAARRILDDCAMYFQRRPYGWFNALDQILRPALAASYFDGSACHLDLVQWATDPIWQDLPEQVQARLLSADRSFWSSSSSTTVSTWWSWRDGPR